MMTILSSSRWNTFLDCARLHLLGEVLQIAPPYSYERVSPLGMSSHHHDHHIDDKLQAYDLSEMSIFNLHYDLINLEYHLVNT